MSGRESRDGYEFTRRASMSIAANTPTLYTQIYNTASNTEFLNQTKSDLLFVTPANWDATNAEPDGGGQIVCIGFGTDKNADYDLAENSDLENTNFSGSDPFAHRFIFMQGTFSMNAGSNLYMPGEADDTELNWAENLGGHVQPDKSLFGGFYTGDGQADHTAGNYMFKMYWGTNAFWIYLNSSDHHLKIVYADGLKAAWSILMTLSPKLNE